MFRANKYLILVYAFYISVTAFAQLSPGDLISAHAHLEGLSNCTKCHTLGDKVSNAKCLDCHTQLKSRIDRGEGFHVSVEVKNQDCFKCHSDHHGRNFETVRFDKEKFDHDHTGYPLTGAHDKLKCTECHKDEFIADKKLRERKDTYLGLSTECVACHTDFHQGTLEKKCTECHTTEAFVPASAFSHDKTEFPLKGAHEQVDCASCHQVSTRNGSSFQEFAGLAFANCSSCHDDVHEGRFGTNCKECHVEESFHAFRGMGNFNHNKTGFPLLGKHKTISCAECHDTHVSSEVMFKDYLHQDVSNCVSCHDDVHEQRFGTDCKACHTEDSFQRIRDLDALDHDLTGFALEGKHEQVDCKKCHETKMTEPLVHSQCADCHSDYHEGQFVSVSRTPDCAECHTVDGFAGSSFTVEQHNTGKFALTGAHLATPCFSCHLREEKWLFRSIGERCIDCHDDVHEGTIAAEFYPDKACERCHITDSWATVSFDHAVTGFTIEGAHLRQACTACHEPDLAENSVRRVSFTGLTAVCMDCHENAHRDQFEIDGITDCKRCHNADHWQPSVFDHNTAQFVLEGAHITVACDQCHREVVEDGVTFVQYRIEKFACIDCHL